MKYIIRAIKYYIYLAVVLALVILVLSLLGIASKDPSEIFRNGYDSYWQIAAMMAVFALVYPRFGFTRRLASLPGATEEIRPEVIEYMHRRGYILESQDGDNLTFRVERPLLRVTRMFEDRVTMTRIFAGYEVEGLTKDVARIVSGLEYIFRNPDEQ